MKVILLTLLLVGSTIAQTDSSKFDPCNDKVLLRLQAKDSLTTDEMKMYVELKRQCTESQNFDKTNKNQTQAIDNLHSVQKGVNTYLIVSLVIGIVGMIIILAH
jgi:hypothetical protein